VTDTFTYSTGGELLSATVGGQTVTYAYDASGRRVARTDTSGTYQYIYGAPGSVMPKAVRQPSGATSVLYYDASGALMAFDRGSDRFYVGSD
jgi:YD repeat-containing protein